MVLHCLHGPSWTIIHDLHVPFMVFHCPIDATRTGNPPRSHKWQATKGECQPHASRLVENLQRCSRARSPIRPPNAGRRPRKVLGARPGFMMPLLVLLLPLLPPRGHPNIASTAALASRRASSSWESHACPCEPHACMSHDVSHGVTCRQCAPIHAQASSIPWRSPPPCPPCAIY